MSLAWFQRRLRRRPRKPGTAPHRLTSKLMRAGGDHRHGASMGGCSMANGGRQATSRRRAPALLALVGLLVVGSCSGNGPHTSPSSTSPVGSTTPVSTTTGGGTSGVGDQHHPLIEGIRL